MKNREAAAVIYAFAAAVFYALNVPFSKLLLQNVTPAMMAAFLYIGAGVGVGIMYLTRFRKEEKAERINRQDLVYIIGMIALDILAPIFLMTGVRVGSAANASLLGNFEIVMTALIALLLFKESVSGKLWLAIAFITFSGILLSFDGGDSFAFSYGSLFVILATLCWGLENNCTRKISDKSTYQIVIMKGVFSGGGSFLVALCLGEMIPNVKYILCAAVLGFVAYGLSIFFYVRAQRELGAAKTSAYYAAAPFIGTVLTFAVNGEQVTRIYFIALMFMIIGTAFAVYDTLAKR